MNSKGTWILTAIVAAALLMPASAAPTLAATESDENTYECDMSPGKTIYFDLKSGANISILGWDQSRARVEYVQRGDGE